MAIAIRLSRGGAKKRPYYRIVVSDSRSPRDGKYLEQIGTYNPLLPKDSEERVKLDEDRARHWLGVGAQPSDRVARFLDAAGVREREARVNLKKGEPGEKAKERAEERAAKAAEAEEAAKAVEEAPVEEAPAEEATAEAAAPSTDKPAEGSETPETGDAAAIESTTDTPVEGSEATADEALAEAPAEEAEAEEAPAEAAPAAEEGAAAEAAETADEVNEEKAEG